MSDVFKVEYWDGIQYVIRIARCLRPGVYLVFDRYDDGQEFLITRSFTDHTQSVFTQEETVCLLDSVVV